MYLWMYLHRYALSTRNHFSTSMFSAERKREWGASEEKGTDFNVGVRRRREGNMIGEDGPWKRMARIAGSVECELLRQLICNWLLTYSRRDLTRNVLKHSSCLVPRKGHGAVLLRWRSRCRVSTCHLVNQCSWQKNRMCASIVSVNPAKNRDSHEILKSRL